MNIKTNTKMFLTIMLVVIISMVSNANADFTFGEPTNLGPTINSPNSDFPGSFTSDGLEMYFDSNRIGGSWDTYDIYVSTRATTDDAWGTPVKLGPLVNSSTVDACPIISTDGLSLYFTSLNRAGGYGSLDIWVATRATVSDPWGESSNLGPTINTSQDDIATSISCDGLVLYFYQKPPPNGPGDIYMLTRPTTNDAWGEPVNLGPIVNSSDADGSSCISANGLLLFFFSNRPGGFGDRDLYMTRRATDSEPWAEAVNLGPLVNTAAGEDAPVISADGNILYFASSRPGGIGGEDIWQAPILPVVDLNGDGIVDSADMCIMVDHWGEYYPLCDIGPTPLGDGIVNVDDLKVLAEHLFEDVNDPTLIAHWPLDEAQGDISYDNVGTCDGTLLGAPVWQPDGGMVAGALQFDGVDDCIVTDSIPNSIKGPFSVLTWVMGSAPGQVVISQEGGADWIMTDVEGNLMTELRSSGRSGKPLQSQTNITDGYWHRIGLVWDGSVRTLYVDDVVVAQDTQQDLGGSDSGLYIGCGKGMEPGTYFSGLIDDVRIYNRVVRP
ncbi:MAG: LamG-like jellyroll fold domain-containing protein [Planctomycetota bacterium]|jgi:Tol biopolymer transport system component